MIQLGLEGKNNEAYEIHYKMMDIIEYIFAENNPAGIKTVLQKLGICKNEVRLPLVKASAELEIKINKFITNF
jgi:4-hydroxy-tetrahydrodipicolinate synthase